MPTQTDAQLGDYLARLRKIPEVLEQTRALMDAGLARGLSVPAICLRAVPEQIDAHLVDDVFDSPELVPLVDAPQAVRDEAAAFMREEVQPRVPDPSHVPDRDLHPCSARHDRPHRSPRRPRVVRRARSLSHHHRHDAEGRSTRPASPRSSASRS